MNYFNMTIFIAVKVIIKCYAGFIPCTNGTLRLVNGSSTNEGRLEICINGCWGTICDDSWTNANAQVACRQLGYSTTGK